MSTSSLPSEDIALAQMLKVLIDNNRLKCVLFCLNSPLFPKWLETAYSETLFILCIGVVSAHVSVRMSASPELQFQTLYAAVCDGN